MDIADEIKRRLSMDEVVRRYGFEPNRAGNILCPFHHEKTPSLKVYAEPGRGWHCFGCDKGGSVIDFVMHLFNIPFSAALVRLNADFQLGLSAGGRPDPRELARLKRERAEQDEARAAYERGYTDRCRRRREMWERLKAMGADDPDRSGVERTLAAMDDWFDRNPYCRERGEQH